MKTKTTITEITHDDLVNLLCSATYGSEWLCIKRPKGSYRGTELEEEGDCIEDTWAKILLANKTVYVYDYFANDAEERYGKLPCTYKNDAMRYEMTLEDIKKGLQKCFDGTFKANDEVEKEYMRKCAMRFLYEDIDLTDAENIIQIIIFGELIYC